MDKVSWQAHYGFDENTMIRIELALKIFKGKIVKIIIDRCTDNMVI